MIDTKRIVKTKEGLYRVRNAQIAQQYRMNVGTIVEAASLNVRLASKRGPKRPGRILGTVEEWLIEHMTPGDTFLFAGEVLRLEGVDGNGCAGFQSGWRAAENPFLEWRKVPSVDISRRARTQDDP